MIITSAIPTGNGRVHRISATHTEVELIAYSKGSRYFCIEISDIDTPRLQEITIVPDSLYRETTFPYKCHSNVWIKSNHAPEWQRVELVEKTPERIRFHLSLTPGHRYLVSSEPPNCYTDTTRYLHDLVSCYPQICSLHNIGFSMEYRPMFALRISDRPVAPGNETKPVIHIVAGEHASEFAGEEIARGMLGMVLSDEASELRQNFIFDFILNANPDGNIHGWHQYNLNDWREHNYQDNKDRSWHHEFAPYLKDESGRYSPETIALMDWLKKTRPACHLSMHSWEGQNGNPGAFYTAEEELDSRTATAIKTINQIAQKQAGLLGFSFIPYSSKNDNLHLGNFLMQTGRSIAYLPEGNYAVGKNNLQKLGAGILQDILQSPDIPLHEYGGVRWDKKLTR